MLKVNWFSPVPPARSGIADYSVQILPVLARRHNVAIWTDQKEVAPELADLAPVFRFDAANPPWRDINAADISIYHIGNNALFHEGIWQISRRHPGIVILHDLCVHDFFAAVYLYIHRQLDGYVGTLERWYGRNGGAAAEVFSTGHISGANMSQQYPLTREAASGALGLITHNPGGLAGLNEMPSCPFRELRFPFARSEESAQRRAALSRRADSGPPYRLLMFGHLGPNRRLDPVLEALSGLAEPRRFVLDICGEVWDRAYVEGQIRRLGLKDIVRMRGFVTESEREELFNAGHLAINLRFPSMGEASLTQMQFWDHALPTMVTRVGWYSSLSPEAAVFVRPEHEVADIQMHLNAFLNDPARFRAMGERGRAILEQHSPETYVAQIAEFAQELLASPRISELALARRVGKECASWLHPRMLDYAVERASREIAGFGRHTPAP